MVVGADTSGGDEDLAVWRAEGKRLDRVDLGEAGRERLRSWPRALSIAKTRR